MPMERACTIAVYVHVCIICTWGHIVDVSGAAARMQIMRRIYRCGWRMSLLWRAVHLHGPYSYGLMLIRCKKYAHMHGRGATVGYRIQRAGCRWSARRVGNAASVRGIVRKHDCALPTLYPKHSNAPGAIIRVMVDLRWVSKR